MENKIVTEADVRRINDRIIKKDSRTLSANDESFFKRIKRTVRPFSKTTLIVEAYKKAAV